MDREARELIEFLRRRVVRQPDIELNEDTALVSSGLVDSFSLVEVLNELERVTGLQIPAGRVSPLDLDSVRRMLETARRWGQPRK
ncbi:MAG: acyl carrier protein [Acidobacteriota bacterium]